MTTGLFFESTQSITRRMGDLFNFIFTTVSALWNLRWQVRGFVDTTGSSELLKLNERFVTGSGITSADLKTACLLTTWEAQKEQFAKFILFELCSMYEAWLEDVVPRAVSSNAAAIMKSLQFPTQRGNRFSFDRAYRAVNAHVSRVMKTEFFPALRVHRKNSWSHIQDLLKAYRYFKEIRNALIHRDGIADARTVDAFTSFASIPYANLGLTEAMLLPTLAVGNKVAVGFKNVIGFSNILHRLIVTLDAMLAVSKVSEKDLIDRFRRINRNPNALSKKDVVRRHKHLLRLLNKAGIPRPIATANLESLLIAEQVIV